jgi:hypothetical protein
MKPKHSAEHIVQVPLEKIEDFRSRPIWTLRLVLAVFGLVKYERRSIKSWADAQRQPASRARWLSPNGEDVAGPATKRVKPQASRPPPL